VIEESYLNAGFAGDVNSFYRRIKDEPILGTHGNLTGKVRQCLPRIVFGVSELGTSNLVRNIWIDLEMKEKIMWLKKIEDVTSKGILTPEILLNLEKKIDRLPKTRINLEELDEAYHEGRLLR
jgi:hypothetical protein